MKFIIETSNVFDLRGRWLGIDQVFTDFFLALVEPLYVLV